MTKTLELTDTEQTMFADFMQWVQNYNEYIINAYAEKAEAAMMKTTSSLWMELVDIESS